MSITAPVSAVIAAVVPVLVGIVSGERPGARALVGIPVAIVAIVLFSSSPATEAHHVRPTAASLLYAAIAGVGFGTFFVFLAQVRREAELSRCCVEAPRYFGRRRRSRLARAWPQRRHWWMVGLAGVFDIAGAFSRRREGFALGGERARLALSAGTVILARLVLHGASPPPRYGVRGHSRGIVLVASG
jgi:hypothetical protein